jgi:hypothetical protein
MNFKMAISIALFTVLGGFGLATGDSDGWNAKRPR